MFVYINFILGGRRAYSYTYHDSWLIGTVIGRDNRCSLFFHTCYSHFGLLLFNNSLGVASDRYTTYPYDPRSKRGVSTITVYPKKYAHGFVVLCFVVVMQSFIMNSHEVFIHIHQGCFAGTGAIVRLPQCQWSKPDGYGKISQCITTTKHSKAKTVCIFLGIYCTFKHRLFRENTNIHIYNNIMNIWQNMFLNGSIIWSGDYH